MKLQAVRVHWDDPEDTGGTFEAWDLGARWNGFLEPWMTADQVTKLIASDAEYKRDADPIYCDTLAFDGQTLTITFAPVDELEGDNRFDAQQPRFFDGVPMWNVGFGWTWMEVD